MLSKTTVKTFQKISHRSLILISMILLVMFTIVSSITCGRRNRPSGKEVKKTIEESFPNDSIEPPIPIVPRKAIEVYIDASGSMQGFLNSPGGSQSTQYIDFVTALAAYLASICSEDSSYWYSFGTYTTQFFEKALDAVRYSWFYNQDSTQLGPLIQGFSARPDSELPKAIVVVTDGIQSTPEGSDFTEVVRGVAQWLGRGCNFEILLFKSDFFGPVYSETGKRSGIYKLEGYSSLEYGLRPFYCYIFSVVPDWGRKLKSILESRSSISCKLLNFPDTLFAKPTAEVQVSDRISSNEKNPLKEWGTEEDVKFLYWKSKKESMLIGELIADIALRAQSGVSDFIFNPRNLNVKVECIKLDSKNKVNSPLVTLIDVSPDSISIIDISAPTIKIKGGFSFNEIEEPGWVAYHILIYPTEATFCPPSWVDDWSTDCDLYRSDFSKSLYFKEFITNIMNRAQFGRQYIADFNLAIRGR
jgi:hypothetical protein